MVSWFEPQNRQIQFDDLDVKVTATVSCFGPQNQSSFGLSVAPQNQRKEVGAGHASRSSRLLRHEVSLASFPVWHQDWRRCDDGWCTWHYRGGCVKWMLKTNGSMRRGAAFSVLGPKGNLIF
jgi:hypothetical protein